MFNRIINVIASNFKSEVDLYSNQRSIYVDMYGFLAKEGENITHLQKLINYCDLKKEEFSEFEVRVVFIANKCCSECDKIDRMKIPLAEALKKQPLPNPNCTREKGCFCCYGFEGLRDNNGRLIIKSK